MTNRTLTFSLACVLAGALLTSCAGPARPTHDAPTQAVNLPPITAAQASALLADISRRNNEANARRDPTLLAEYEDESSLRIDAADYRVRQALDPDNTKPSRPFTYTNITFHLPAATDEPQWFLAYSAISGSSAHYILVLSRQKADAPWKIVTGAKAADTPPELARDPAGNAITAPAGDTAGLLAAPNGVAQAHAAYLTAGTSSPDAQMFAPDPRSKQIVDDAQLRSTLVFLNLRTGQIVPAATYTRTVTVEPYPVRALRTVDGAVIAAYTTRLDIVAEQPDGITKIGGADAALAGRTIFHTKITITTLDQWVVLIPPQGHGQVRVLANLATKVAIT